VGISVTPKHGMEHRLSKFVLVAAIILL